MDSHRIEELVAESRRAAFLSDPSEAVRTLDEALAVATEPGHIGGLLLARALARQGAADLRPTAADAKASISYLIEAGDSSAAAFAMACAAGMIHRTGDTSAAIDLAVEALVQLPEDSLYDEYLVRAANAMAILFAQMSAFDLAITSSRRAFADADNLPDSSGRSIVAYTLGYCAVEAIRSGGMSRAMARAFNDDLTRVVAWLTSDTDNPLQQAILGSGMRAEQVLLQHHELVPPARRTSVVDSKRDLMTVREQLIVGSETYHETAPRLVAWHQLVTASVHRVLGEADAAEFLLDRALPELVSIADEHRIVRALNERSTARAMSNDLLGALEDAREVARHTRHWQQHQGARLGTQIARRAELEQARSLLRRRADDLAKEAAEDPVTGLATRRWLEVRLDELARSDGDGTVLVLDLDRFKRINDTFGHQIGDRVLGEVGRLLRSLVRAEVSAARFGGEEFVILLPGIDRHAGVALAERIRIAINGFEWGTLAPDLRVTISIGVTSGPLVGVRELVRIADTALYDAKRAGRDRVVGV